MSENATLALDGLFTRFGSQLRNFQGFGHEQDEHTGNWVWYFKADIVSIEPAGEHVLPSRKVFMDQVCHDPTDPDDGEIGERNMRALSEACMEYLVNHGYFDKRGWWHGRAA